MTHPQYRHRLYIIDDYLNFNFCELCSIVAFTITLIYTFIDSLLVWKLSGVLNISTVLTNQKLFMVNFQVNLITSKPISTHRFFYASNEIRVSNSCFTIFWIFCSFRLCLICRRSIISKHAKKITYFMIQWFKISMKLRKSYINSKSSIQPLFMT